MKDEKFHARKVQQDIDRVQSRLNRETFISLLLIWAASLPDFPLGRTGREKAAAASCPQDSPISFGKLLVALQSAKSADVILDGLIFLEGRFPFVRFLMDGKIGAEADVFALRELMELLSVIPPEFSRPVLEHCVKKEMEKYAGKGGSYRMPAALARSVRALLVPEGGTVCELSHGLCDFFAGGDARWETKERQEDGTRNGAFKVVCAMNFLLCERSAPEKAAEIPVVDRQCDLRKWDYILANPPFNISNWYDGVSPERERLWRYGVPPRSNAHFAWLQHFISGLHERGRAAIILPISTLMGRKHEESGIRRKIIESGVVEAIMAFPPRVFDAVKVPFCLWLLDKARQKTRNEEILFMDAGRMEPRIRGKLTEKQIGLLVEGVSAFKRGQTVDNAWTAVATFQDIAAQDYRLSPNLYIRTDSEPAFLKSVSSPDLAVCLMELKKYVNNKGLLAHLEPWTEEEEAGVWHKVRLTAFYDIFGGLSVSKDDFGQGEPFLDVKTIVRHPFLPETFSKQVRVSKNNKEKYAIRRGDVIINRTSESLEKLGCGCVALKDSPAVYTGFAKRLRPKYPNVLVPSYAAAYFRSSLHHRQVMLNVPLIPISRASLNNEHLARMYVYYPSLERQRKIGEGFYALNALKQDADPELGQLLSSVQYAFLERAISPSHFPLE